MHAHENELGLLTYMCSIFFIICVYVLWTLTLYCTLFLFRLYDSALATSILKVTSLDLTWCTNYREILHVYRLSFYFLSGKQTDWL